MNKREAIQELQNQARHHCGEIECYKDGCEKSVELSKAINIVSRIDEPQKVVIPKFIADWIEECKTNCFSISYALNHCPEMSDRHGFTSTFDQETFADAWVNGYEIEPERLYTVSEIKQDFAWAWDAGFAREVPDGEAD